MARTINRLTARGVESIKTPGRHADGGNLYLSVGSGGAKSWVFVYRQGGKIHEKGLGSARTVDLKGARSAATELRKLLVSGGDPLAVVPTPIPEQAPNIVTFGEMADEFIKSMESSWRNLKHQAQWRSTLENYASSLTEMSVQAITTDHVLDVLKPIWSTKPETASRVRGRIERVLSAAKAKKLRTGENPAAWRDHLDHLLPPRARLTRGHHAALPFDALSQFVTDLRQRDGMSPRALEFTILTAARTGEVLGARRCEVDRKKAVWTIPAERMKAGRQHRVPLATEALALLGTEDAAWVDPTAFLFPGAKVGRPLSTMALETVLRRMKVTNATVHGFRSTFHDWASETTQYSNEVVEMALAHTIRSKTEAAYRRGDLLEKRRELMDAWAKHCALPAEDGQ